MKHDTTSITNDLKHEAAEHADKEAPSTIPCSKADLRDENEGKYDQVCKITTQAWVIFNLRALFWTCRKCAVGRVVWAGAAHGCGWQEQAER